MENIEGGDLLPASPAAYGGPAAAPPAPPRSPDTPPPQVQESRTLLDTGRAFSLMPPWPDAESLMRREESRVGWPLLDQWLADNGLTFDTPMTRYRTAEEAGCSCIQDQEALPEPMQAHPASRTVEGGSIWDVNGNWMSRYTPQPQQGRTFDASLIVPVEVYLILMRTVPNQVRYESGGYWNGTHPSNTHSGSPNWSSSYPLGYYSLPPALFLAPRFAYASPHTGRGPSGPQANGVTLNDGMAGYGPNPNVQNQLLLLHNGSAVHHSSIPGADTYTSGLSSGQIGVASPTRAAIARGDGQEDNTEQQSCTCPKTKCLLRYCPCFAAGVYCLQGSCTCINCHNNPDHTAEIQASRATIESREPDAFKQRIVDAEPPAGEEDNGDRSTGSKGRYEKGCSCPKSGCQKKYCECLKAGVGCWDGCRCADCRNPRGARTPLSTAATTADQDDLPEAVG